MLVWRFMYKFLCGHIFLLLLYIYQDWNLPGSADSHNNSIFNFFEEVPDYFPMMLNHFTFSPAVTKYSSFSMTLSTLVNYLFFYYNHYSVCEVVSHWFAFSWWLMNDVEPFFMHLFIICIYSLEKYLFTFFAHFFSIQFYKFYLCFGCVGSSLQCMGSLLLYAGFL